MCASSKRTDFHVRPLILQRPKKRIDASSPAPVHRRRRALQEISEAVGGLCLRAFLRLSRYKYPLLMAVVVRGKPMYQVHLPSLQKASDQSEAGNGIMHTQTD